MDGLLKQLREFLNTCALRADELKKLVEEAQTEKKKLTEERLVFESEKSAFDVKRNEADAYFKKKDQSVSLDKREEELASNKAIFARDKERTEQALNEKKKEVTELLNKLEIKRKKIAEIVQDEAVKRRLEEAKIEW